MPRHLITTLVTIALLAGGLLANPAQAAWTRPADLTQYRICRASADGGDTWRFVSKVKKYGDTPDARAGIKLYSGNELEARWSSGWLDQGETRTSTVQAPRSKKVRVQIWEEAGDLDSSIGTTAQAFVLKPKKIRHC